MTTNGTTKHRNHRVHPVVRTKVLELKDAGIQPADISERTGVPVTTVRTIARAERARLARIKEKKRRERKKAEKLWDRITKRNKEKKQS